MEDGGWRMQGAGSHGAPDWSLSSLLISSCAFAMTHDSCACFQPRQFGETAVFMSQ